MIRLEEADGVLVVTWARPEKRNALGVADYAAVAERFEQTASGGKVAAVLIRSEGETFCAGNNTAEFETQWPQPRHGPVYRFFKALADLPMPVVAAVQGGAIGIGATMLLHCDIVLLATSAYLKFPFIQLGISPEGAATRILPERVGRARAMEIFLSGRAIPAAEAVALGLASAECDREDLDAMARDWVTKIAALRPAAVRRTKALVTEADADATAALFEAEIVAINGLVESRRAGKG